jgi:glycerophosphoryl diester phosphodiesterase
VTNVIAHRGASRVEPENTVAAFRRARAFGADWVELDVRWTADRGLAVHHDAALSDGRLVASVSAAALPPDVALLDAALDACGGIGVHVEIKNAPEEAGYDASGALAAAVARAAAAWGGPVVVSCFDLATVDAARRHGAATAWLVVDVNTAVVATLVEHAHGALNPWDGAVTEEVVRWCHAADVGVNVWTVDDPVRMRELAAWGVEGIVTNVPDIAVAALRLRA